MTTSTNTPIDRDAQMAAPRPHPHLLEVSNLCIDLDHEDGSSTSMVEDLSLRVRAGCTTALVGESGCGKSLTALALMGLLPRGSASVVAGSIRFSPDPQAAPRELTSLAEGAWAELRGRHLAMIFQEPMTALNPVYTVGEQIIDVLRVHHGLGLRAARARAAELLHEVGIPAAADRLRAYPHELSGGMRQRVLMAMALAGEPEVLVADEPTTALDVTVQAQVLELLERLCARRGLGVLLITHDLGVVAQVAAEVCVMYAGRIVEQATVERLFAEPAHPYTQALLACVPRLDTSHADAAETLPSDGDPSSPRLATIPGRVPDASCLPAGCRFHPRCPLTQSCAARDGRSVVTLETEPGAGEVQVLRRCVEQTPDEPSGAPSLREIAPGHMVACWKAEPAGDDA
jgi:peptide/nickel transport system ATP-binding protein